MRKFFEYTAVYSIGAAGYSLTEILWRGFTHWTMTLLGGFCFLCIYVLNRIAGGASLIKKCLAGSLLITTAELIVGFVVNILLNWNVWDYSDMRFNFKGQICPLYSFFWFLLCIPASFLCGKLERLFSEGIWKKGVSQGET